MGWMNPWKRTGARMLVPGGPVMEAEVKFDEENMTIEAVVIRADGTREDLGVISRGGKPVEK